MSGGCEGEWDALARRISSLYARARELASKAALRGRPRLFRAASRAAEALLDLQHDLEAWDPGECFDVTEFSSRLSRVEGVLGRVEDALAVGRPQTGASPVKPPVDRG